MAHLRITADDVRKDTSFDEKWKVEGAARSGSVDHSGSDADLEQGTSSTDRNKMGIGKESWDY